MFNVAVRANELVDWHRLQKKEEQVSANSKTAEITNMIKRIRAEKGVSQRELARRIGVSPAVMNRIENGGGNLESSTILRISEALEVEPASLFGAYSEDFLELWQIFKSLPDERRQLLISLARDQGRLASIDGEDTEHPAA
jgi:transcriptional regulator with XRE-family HTH domain